MMSAVLKGIDGGQIITNLLQWKGCCGHKTTNKQNKTNQNETNEIYKETKKTR